METGPLDLTRAAFLPFGAAAANPPHSAIEQLRHEQRHPRRTIRRHLRHSAGRSPSPVLALCRKLIEGSTYGSSAPLDAYRGNTLCLRVLGIGEAAGLEVNGGGTGFRALRSRP